MSSPKKRTPTPTARTGGKKRKARTPTTEERIAVKDAADATRDTRRDWLQSLSPRERRAYLKDVEKYLANTAPSMKVAKSDLLKMLQIVGALFVERYYADATTCHIYVAKYSPNSYGGAPEYTVMVPMIAPVKGGA